MATIVSQISPNIAPVYSSASTYTAGQCVLFHNQYWRCIEDIETPESWTSAHWEAVPDVISGINEVVLGGEDEPTIGKLWVDYDESSDPEIEEALVADFDPDDPSTYVKSFIQGSYVTNRIKTVVNGMFSNADTTTYPYDDSSSSSDDTDV